MGFMRVIFVCTIVLVGSASATWCGCQNNGGGCQSCCGTPPDSTPYAKVWEADFSGANVAEQWEIETWDPSGDQASKYVNDGSTIIVSNNSLKLQLVEMKVANGARYKSARLKSKASFQYGLYMVDVVDFNVAGCGMWPAIWMVSSHNRFGGWPNSGEIDFFETINLAAIGMESSMNYGSCERGQNEVFSYCRHRNFFHPMPARKVEMTLVIEWTPDSISFYKWPKAQAPKDANAANPCNRQGGCLAAWPQWLYGTFWRAGSGYGPSPTVPVPPYDHAKLDPIMGFYCPSIQPTTNKADYDKRCVPGNQFCPGADTFQGKKGGGGCDFNAPFGPAACDQPGMHFVMNIKVCGAWPESVAPGACCLADGGPANGYTAVNGLNGKSMTIGSMRVYQRERPALRKLCCPKTQNETELQAKLDELCAMTEKLECSPIQPGGVYFEPNTLLHHAQWAFNEYYQRDHASMPSDLLCSSLGDGIAEIRLGTTDCSQSRSEGPTPPPPTPPPTPPTPTPTTATPTTVTPTTLDPTPSPTNATATPTPTTYMPTTQLPTTQLPTTAAPTRPGNTTAAPTNGKVTAAPTRSAATIALKVLSKDKKWNPISFADDLASVVSARLNDKVSSDRFEILQTHHQISTNVTGYEMEATLLLSVKPAKNEQDGGNAAAVVSEIEKLSAKGTVIGNGAFKLTTAPPETHAPSSGGSVVPAFVGICVAAATVL